MWLLSYVAGDQNVLEGKRLWLRPGTGHLFGRTSSKPTTGERSVYINDHAISRKHVTFRVAAPSSGSSTRLQERTAVTIVDGSKKGTYIDKEKIVQGEKVVDGSQGHYMIRLGETQHTLKLEWKEVVLCFTNLSRGAKKSGSALAEEKQKLEGCDVKLATDYVTNTTTHVVAKKRNTSAGLQALVQGKWVVTSSWVDALAEVVKKKGPEEASPLEEDFDGAWPKEVDFIVPASGEPNPRPNDYLKPDLERMEVFAGYTFVFLSPTQYESLFPVVAGGGGKALQMDFQLGQTTVDDVVDLVKGLLGKKKGGGQLLLSQEPGPGGIVIVRMVEKEDNREAMAPLMEELSITLNQRTIEQSELLDAILTKNATVLRQPLRGVSQSVRPEQSQSRDAPVTSSSFPRPPPRETPVEVRDSPPADTQAAARPGRDSQMQSQQQPQAEQAPAEDAPPTRRRNRRMVTAPRKIDFDDWDPSQFAAPESSVQEPSASYQDASQAASVQAMDVDEPAAEATQRQTQTQKRPAEKQLVKEEEIDETLYPGMAAMKRRKTEAQRKGKASQQPTPEPEASAAAGKAAKGKNGKVKTEDKEDIKTRIKKRREEEEEARRKDHEALEEAMTADLANMKVEHVVETFEPPAAPVQATQTQSTSQNPAWNGRPNFKKFRSNKRPRGDELERPDTQQRLLISLQEIPNKSQGLGDDYWLETGRDHERRQGTKSQSKSQSQRSSHNAAPDPSSARQAGLAGFGNGDSDEDDTMAFRRRLQRSREEDREEAVIEQQLNPKGTAGSTQTEGRTQRGGKKRSALEELMGETMPPPKKARAGAGKAAVQRKRTAAALDLDEEEGDGEEDPMAFRRKRR
ncbi:hypothetical protein PRZ48_001899 [Zasmidium cellare]|uniref:FHA domain-containing protein n=1 Tax=Zasmidium cellare TaxID=395010 RepID=A0ABR0F4C5_ZASCE|nr:hypothetical protein PRZ48_001899 [Zasmidium cellare]